MGRLCCLCGIHIEANPAAMCVNCIRTQAPQPPSPRHHPPTPTPRDGSLPRCPRLTLTAASRWTFRRASRRRGSSTIAISATGPPLPPRHPPRCLPCSHPWGCGGSWLQPPDRWMPCELESKELLSICLKKLRGPRYAPPAPPPPTCASHRAPRLPVLSLHLLNRVAAGVQAS
jgi:hypothetical protein